MVPAGPPAAPPLPPGPATAEPFGLARYSPREYLQHYWPATSMDSEDVFILRFLHEEYSRHRPTKGLLELGGGPVIDKYISASGFVSHIVHTDVSKTALHEVAAFQQRRPDAWDWQLRCDFVAALECAREKGVPAEHLGRDVAQRVREKLARGSINELDLKRLKRTRDDDWTADVDMSGIGVVSVHSVCECVAGSEDEWRTMLGRVLDLCVRGTLLVMTVNTCTETWAGGAGSIKAVPVAPEDVISKVEAAGFANICWQLRSNSDGSAATEMQETLALSAVRQ